MRYTPLSRCLKSNRWNRSTSTYLMIEESATMPLLLSIMLRGHTTLTVISTLATMLIFIYYPAIELTMKSSPIAFSLNIGVRSSTILLKQAPISIIQNHSTRISSM